MTSNRMELEWTLSDERLELFISQPLDNGLTRGEQMELVREELARRKASKEAGKVRRFDLDMSDCDSCGQDCGADMVEDLDGEYVLWEEVIPYLYQHAEYTAPPLQAVTVPDEMRNRLKAEGIAELLRDALGYAPLTTKQWEVLANNWHETFVGLSGDTILKSVTSEP